MEKINVCLLNDSYPPLIDGVANTVVNYATILKQQELANPFVVTPYFPGSDDSVFDFPVLRYKSLNIGNLVEGYRAGLPFSGTLLKDIIDRKPDIIHTHCPVVSTVISRELRDRIDAPIVFTYHTKFDVDIAKAVKSKRIQKDVAKFLVRNISACDEVWVVSKGAGDNLRALGYEGDMIVMNNGVDFPKGKADQNLVDEVVKEYGIDFDGPILLFVGRLLWYKGIKIIVDALKMLREDMDFRMVFVGKGADEDEMKAYVKEVGMEDKCIFNGPIYNREKLRAVNTKADLFLFPSTYDTNGLVVREAAACGLASVVIEGSCAAEDITDGRNGFFCMENAESMYKKLAEILVDLDNVRKVGENAMNEIYISWDESVKIANERYKLLIEKKKNGMLRPAKEGRSDDFYKLSTDALLALKQARIASVNEFLNVKNKTTNAVTFAKDTTVGAVNLAKDTTVNAVTKARDKAKERQEIATDKFREVYTRLKNSIYETEKDDDYDDIKNQDRYL